MSERLDQALGRTPNGPHAGVAGQKRIEILEELGKEIIDWKFSSAGPNWVRINDLARRLRADDERIARNLEEWERFVEWSARVEDFLE